MVDAIFYNGHVESVVTVGQWMDAFRKGDGLNLSLKAEGLFIGTYEGSMLASPGDYIIRGVDGEYYPCKPTIFHDTYQVLDGDK